MYTKEANGNASFSVIVPLLTGMISDVTESKVYIFYLSVFVIESILFYVLNRIQNQVENH